ncbi:DUF2235 domain-containing protein [Arthrobacter sp. NPDC093125]|uniref:DUF2235 domain-containing protein n=1 Tax=Arthrobacter sp. NPDC093125 TaxID=3363944 RepID=UPI0038289B55
MTKNIVLCFDGTSNRLKARASTNVVRLFEMLDLSDPEQQIAYYSPGVGTFSSPGAWTPAAQWVSKMLGLAFGAGLRKNLGEAYTFLIQRWEPGDRLFLFGFSRGAYTARALAGLLHTCGLPRGGCENLVPYAVSEYARERREFSADDWTQIRRFAGTFSVPMPEPFKVPASFTDASVPVEFLGVWDTVKTAGNLRGELKWPYTRQIPNVRRVWHAVALDEKRGAYREYLVQAKSPWPEVAEVWFAGVHSDIGGGFAENDSDLAHIALKWIADGAIGAGVTINPGAYRKICPLTTKHASGKVHWPGLGRAVLWRVCGGYGPRSVPPGARIHSSVRRRIGEDGKYRDRIPADAGWADQEWLTPGA